MDSEQKLLNTGPGDRAGDVPFFPDPPDCGAALIPDAEPACGVLPLPDEGSGMAAALREAEAALQEGEIPVGAALFRGKELLWADHNRREQLHDPTAHAEILCLRESARQLGDWRLSGCTLYVTLEPCPMCAGAQVMSRLGRVIYGAADPEKGCCGSLYDLPADPALSSPTRWRAGEREAECRLLLERFFARRRSESEG